MFKSWKRLPQLADLVRPRVTTNGYTAREVLDADEIKRRIAAARTLRNLSQAALNQMGDEYGLGRQELGRVERGELGFRTMHGDAYTRLLRLPRNWFSAGSIDELLYQDPTQLDRMEAKLDAILDRLGVKPETIEDIVSDFEDETNASRGGDPPDDRERQRRDRRHA